MSVLKTWCILVLISLALCACGSLAVPSNLPPSTPAALTETLHAPTQIVPTASSSPQPSPTLTPSQTTVPSTTPTFTPLPSSTPTLTPIPTYVKLRGEVIIDQAVCHYGPGAPYLYKYGVYRGNNLEIIARMELGKYVEIQAIGGSNPCWLNPDYLKIKGDLMSLKPLSPDEVKLPQSPYYGPLTGVSARRDGDTITVFWDGLTLRAGDDSEQTPYLIEAWVCRGGEFLFNPVGSYQTAVKIVDEPGCTAPSHGRIYAAEKHGYTRAVEIPWPQAVSSGGTEVTSTP